MDHELNQTLVVLSIGCIIFIFLCLYWWFSVLNKFVRLLADVEAAQSQVADSTALNQSDRQEYDRIEDRVFKYNGKMVDDQYQRLRQIMLVEERIKYIDDLKKGPGPPVPVPFPSVESPPEIVSHPSGLGEEAIKAGVAASADQRQFLYALNENIAEYNKLTRQLPERIVAIVHGFKPISK